MQAPLIQTTKDIMDYDKAYLSGEEDKEVGKRLIAQIFDEAKRFGFKGVYKIVDYPNEGIAIYFNTTQEVLDKQIEEGLDETSFGFLSVLVHHLNYDLQSEDSKWFRNPIHIISVGGAPSIPIVPNLDVRLQEDIQYYTPTYEVPTNGYGYMNELEMNNLAYYKGIDIEDNEAFNNFCEENGYMQVFIEELDANIYVYRA